MKVSATPAERAVPRPGDDLVRSDVTMDRAFTVTATPVQVWPWLVQLGKGRGGWYLPEVIERFLPRRHRATRVIVPAWQGLRVGDVIPDYGGADATFEVVAIEAPHHIVYRSTRGRMSLSWAITVEPLPSATAKTRVSLRLRLAPVRRRSLAKLGELVDVITIAGMAAGLRERLADSG